MSRAVDIVTRLQAVVDGTAAPDLDTTKALCVDAIKEINKLRTSKEPGWLAKTWRWLCRTANNIRLGFAGFIEAALLLGSVALIAYGSWQAYKPAGPIIGGILLITGILVRARGKALARGRL